LSGVRTVIVQEDMLDLLARPDPGTMVVARLEAGVIARLSECGPEWCALAVDGHRGWARKAALWGVGLDEMVK
jgi:SH3-like domain-containing protein